MGSKVQFWGPISLCFCAFLGLERKRDVHNISARNSGGGGSPRLTSALGKWGRTQMGSDGFNRVLTGF